MQFKITDGPWRRYEYNDLMIVDKNNNALCTVSGAGGFLAPGSDDALANAIAALPVVLRELAADDRLFHHVWLFLDENRDHPGFSATTRERLRSLASEVNKRRLADHAALKLARDGRETV